MLRDLLFERLMKIIADQDIPFVKHYFDDADLIVGRGLQQHQIKNADILLVRSITKVNEDLLGGTNVKFVASPTTGTDHFDITYLDKAGISWANAHGCNAIAVEEYVVCAIAALQKQGYLTGSHLRAGVIGVGNIGSRVVKKLELLGFTVLQCDPIRAEKENDFPHVPLETFSDLDFISLHTPLTRSGPYPTYHMIQRPFLERQKKNTILMNTGRGAVIDFNDLKLYGEYLIWCLDVWENEPFIDIEVLDRAMIATPHIAGYTVQSKYRGPKMIYDALVKRGIIPDKKVKPLNFPTQHITFDERPVDWRDVVLKVYNPMDTTALMKQTILEDDKVATFDGLRKNFIDRYEFASVKIPNVCWKDEKDKKIWDELVCV